MMVNIVSSYVIPLAPWFVMPQVEVCSGEAQLSRALWSCQFQGKAFDAAWSTGDWEGDEGAYLMTMYSFMIVLWTLIPNDPLGFVFEEPQFSSDGGIPCSTCCSHLALVVTVAYQPHSCVCEHCWTDSLKKKHSSRCATLVKEGLLCFAPPCATGCSWPWYALVSEWKVGGVRFC